MNISELFEVMTGMFAHCGLNMVQIQEEDTPLDNIDLGFRGKMITDFDYRPLFSHLIDNLTPGIFYFFEDELGVCYSFLPFSESLSSQLRCRLLTAGPFLLNHIEPDTFQQLMDKKEIPQQYRADFLEFFNQLPVIPSYESWNQVLAFYMERITGSPLRFEYIHSLNKPWSSFSCFDSDYSIPSQPDVALHAIEKRYFAENSLLQAVASGNTDEAIKMCHNFLQYRILPRIPSIIRDKKNLLITLNTLLRKAAETGGVHPLHIDHLSRQLNIEIESLVTMEQLQRMNAVMVRKYCLLVQNYSRNSYSALVKDCLNQIDFYYNTELSLASLAKTCSISQNYLSTTFKKETGMTVTDYINQTRLRQALLLLNTTSLPIGEIATRCGYFDANYFTRIFKKTLGQSPRQYRTAVRQHAS